MGKTQNIIDVVLLTIGSTWSLANIEQALGIIILSIQLLWILIKCIVKIVEKIKEHQPLDELDEEIGDIVSGLDNIKDFIEELREDESNTTNK